MPDEHKNSSVVPILVAVIGAIGAIFSAYVANEQKNKATTLQGQVIDSRGNFQNLTQRYDSLVTAFNKLAADCQSSNRATAQTILTGTSPSSLGEGRLGEHYIKLEDVSGDTKNQSVTIRFRVTNETRDNFEQVIMNQSIGIFGGTTFYAIRATLGDKHGEGLGNATYPAMQIIKGEPLQASITFTDVPQTVTEFSTLVINANWDRIPFKHIAITWQ